MSDFWMTSPSALFAGLGSYASSEADALGADSAWGSTRFEPSNVMSPDFKLGSDALPEALPLLAMGTVGELGAAPWLELGSSLWGSLGTAGAWLMNSAKVAMGANGSVALGLLWPSSTASPAQDEYPGMDVPGYRGPGAEQQNTLGHYGQGGFNTGSSTNDGHYRGPDAERTRVLPMHDADPKGARLTTPADPDEAATTRGSFLPPPDEWLNPAKWSAGLPGLTLTAGVMLSVGEDGDAGLPNPVGDSDTAKPLTPAQKSLQQLAGNFAAAQARYQESAMPDAAMPSRPRARGLRNLPTLEAEAAVYDPSKLDPAIQSVLTTLPSGEANYVLSVLVGGLTPTQANAASGIWPNEGWGILAKVRDMLPESLKPSFAGPTVRPMDTDSPLTQSEAMAVPDSVLTLDLSDAEPAVNSAARPAKPIMESDTVFARWLREGEPLQQAQRRDFVLGHLDQLSSAQQRVVTLALEENMTLEGIGDATGRDPLAVRGELRNAANRLIRYSNSNGDLPSRSVTVAESNSVFARFVRAGTRAQRDQRLQNILDNVEKLTDLQRGVVELRLAGKTGVEIGQAMNLKSDQVYSAEVNATKILMKHIMADRSK